MNTSAFVPSAEAAFIAGVSDKDMNRLIDERIVPDALVHVDKGRLFSPLAAAFAHFYFETEKHFSAGLRRWVVAELTERISHRKDKDAIFALKDSAARFDWNVELSFTSAHNIGHIDLAAFIEQARGKIVEVEASEALVHSDAGVLGGVPVFVGTRVPVEVVLASLDEGIEFKRVKASYPFLTEEHVSAARVYAQAHPRRGRPRRLGESTGWPPKEQHTVGKSRS